MMKPVALAPATVLAVASPSAAQDQSEDIRVRVGLGAQLRPEFIGADKRDLGPLVDVDIARGSNPFQFEAPDDVFAIPVISSSSFSADRRATSRPGAGVRMSAPTSTGSKPPSKSARSHRSCRWNRSGFGATCARASTATRAWSAR